MKIFELPVARLTRAIMIHRYGPEPIRLAAHDIRRKELMHVGSTNRHLERKQYALNATIKLELNRHDYEHVSSRPLVIGYYLYHQDKRRMFQFVWARVTAGKPALHAIHDYYELCGIEEDDFPAETSERLWKRWYAELQKDTGSNTPQSVPRLTPHLLSRNQASELARRLTQLTSGGAIQIDPRFTRTITHWIFCDLTPMTQREVAKLFDRDQRRLNRSVVAFRRYIFYREDLRKVVGYCLKTTQARPTPSTAS